MGLDPDFIKKHLDRVEGGAMALYSKPLRLGGPGQRKINTQEEAVLNRILCAGLPTPEREYRFHPKRMWRFDFAYPQVKLAIEYEGGTHNSGAHTRGKHYDSDCEKYNAAARAGWRVLRYTATMMDQIAEDVKACLTLS